MSKIYERVEKLSATEIRAIVADLRECHGLHRILKGGDAITHIDQAEARTVFAHHEFPVSREEVETACKAILERASSDPNVIVFPEEIFPQEIG